MIVKVTLEAMIQTFFVSALACAIGAIYVTIKEAE